VSQSESSKTDDKELVWKKLNKVDKPPKPIGFKPGDFVIAVAYGKDGKSIIDFEVTSV